MPLPSFWVLKPRLYKDISKLKIRLKCRVRHSFDYSLVRATVIFYVKIKPRLGKLLGAHFRGKPNNKDIYPNNGGCFSGWLEQNGQLELLSFTTITLIRQWIASPTNQVWVEHRLVRYVINLRRYLTRINYSTKIFFKDSYKRVRWDPQ